MNKKIHAVFENGVFRPTEPIDLPEHAEVEFEITLPETHCKPEIDDVYAVLGKRYDSGQEDVAARHNEHQP